MARLGVMAPLCLEISAVPASHDPKQECEAARIALHEQQMDTFLHEAHAFDSEEERNQRQRVLGQVDAICQDWLRHEARRVGRDSAATADTKLGALHPFGSYALGVSGPSADLDTLLIGPSFIDRERFFESFPDFLTHHPLSKSKSDSLVRDLTCKPDAYVPLVTFYYDNVEMDVLYAQACCEQVDTIDLDNDRVLAGMDEKSILSINGVRVARRILQLVPHHAVFRQTLRYIKVWAKRRALSSNVWGYFGGITWALLLVHTCQLYPTIIHPSLLVQRFFAMYARWRFGPYQPVVLSDVYDTNLGLDIWHLFDYKNKRHLAPILLPTYPFLNTTHNVSDTTLRIIRNELSRGMDLFATSASISSSFDANTSATTNDTALAKWAGLDVATEVDFFFLYKDYVDIVVTSACEADQLVWLGYVESKLRHLFRKWHLHRSLRVHPYPKSFREPLTAPDSPLVDHFFVGLEIDPAKLAQAKVTGDSEKINLDPNELLTLVHRHMPPEQHRAGMDVRPRLIGARDLPDVVFGESSLRPIHNYRRKRKKTTVPDPNDLSAKQARVESEPMPLSSTPSPSSTESGTPSPDSVSAMCEPAATRTAYVPYPLPPPINTAPATSKFGSYEARRDVTRSETTGIVRQPATTTRRSPFIIKAPNFQTKTPSTPPL